MPQGDQIKLIYKFIKSHPPIFKGKTYGTTTLNWKEGVKHQALSLGDDLVKVQRLVAFTPQDGEESGGTPYSQMKGS